METNKEVEKRRHVVAVLSDDELKLSEYFFHLQGIVIELTRFQLSTRPHKHAHWNLDALWKSVDLRKANTLIKPAIPPDVRSEALRYFKERLTIEA